MTGWASRAGTTTRRSASGAEREARVGGRRDQVEVDADRAGHDDGLAAGALAERHGEPAVAQVGAGDGGRSGAKRPQSDPRRVRHQACSQPALGHQLVERVALGVGPAVRAHDLRHACQLGGRAELAVQHARELTVGLADTDLQARLGDRLTCGGVPVDDARHLEAVHLSAHDAVLDHDLEVGVDEQLRQARRGRRASGGGDGVGLCAVQRGRLDAPDLRGGLEAGGSASQHARGALGDQVDVVPGAAAVGPDQRRAEGGDGVGVEQHPGDGPLQQGRPAGEVGGRTLARPELGAHEGTELRSEQRGS